MSRVEVERAIASGLPVSLNGAQLVGADLIGLTLAGADLSYADLEGAQLDRADLRGASLWSAYARSASLVGCDLRDADLQTADLTGADLRGARLVGAVLTGTTLRGALLDGAELAPGQLADAVLGAPLDETRDGRATSAHGDGGGPAYVRLDESDDDSDVALAPGGVLEVELPEGATGYTWQLVEATGPTLSSADLRLEPAASDAGGAFGRRVFRFTASEPGSATVRLRLVQPWDPDGPPAQTFTSRVTIG